MLLQFKKMMQTAPQYFYHCLEDQFGLKVVEILHFSRALEALLWPSFKMSHLISAACFSEQRSSFVSTASSKEIDISLRATFVALWKFKPA